MRPLRFLLLVTFFVALPVFLTCLSLFSGSTAPAQPLSAGLQTRTTRLRALFSFSTPSSLFPPSAVISLTNDNSTFFLARPAAFGPDLPSHGLSGQLWVGRGFGNEDLLTEDDIAITGFELGCSDVPGWGDEHRRRPDFGTVDAKMISEPYSRSETQSKSILPKRSERTSEEFSDLTSTDDGTDDYLHAPHPDSNPASSMKPGEPAKAESKDKSRPPTHADIESLQESADIAGKIVMLSRGGCGFLEKVKWAQRRGGVALIVGDNEPGGYLAIMYAKGDTSNVTIPAIFTSYNAAHLLSSLVPLEKHNPEGDMSKTVPDTRKEDIKKNGAVFTTTTRPRKSHETAKIAHSNQEQGFMQNVLSAVGLADDADAHTDDSRRPPSSGNLDWVLLEDWDEDKPSTTSSLTSILTQATQKATASTIQKSKPKTTSVKKAGDDDFVIGVQDWRDTEVIAPKSMTTHGAQKQNGKGGDKIQQETSSTTTTKRSIETALKGGSITPGSGEYNHDNHNTKSTRSHRKGSSSQSSKDSQSTDQGGKSFWQKLHSVFHFSHDADQSIRTAEEVASSKNSAPTQGRQHGKPVDREGLWVTLTPTNVSTSPFFDTLLVLVISPLVTLTFVYGLLLLRSRVRRRRWRAPKSIVERLPVRTYHTMTSTSSTTSSQLSSPAPSSQNSPQLRPVSVRPRPRSQTTAGVVSTSPVEKNASSPNNTRRKYTGRQIECVVCLEEYIDGESQVMSLPCGHEFHVECITPWLVTRRRTCPICKGDVVRSLTRSSTSGAESSSEEDSRRDDVQTSDDVQEQAAGTVNEESSAAIPIPVRETDSVDEDIERGESADAPLLSGPRRSQPANGWRGVISGSISRLSGETVWRSTPNDRTR